MTMPLMTVANLATYPPRRSSLKAVVDTISPQVDRLNLVLNEYDTELPEFKDYSNVHMILPPTNLKDVGKFYPNCQDAGDVFFIDDDIRYSQDYVSKSRAAFASLPKAKAIGGYYGSIYTKPAFGLKKDQIKAWLRSFSKRRIARGRIVYQLCDALERPVIVDQLGTGVVVMRGTDLPPYEYMQGSETFVDVRLAKWCFENQIIPICLPRPANWLSEISLENSIYQEFTRRDPINVANEIRSYAYQIERRGEEIC